MNRVNRQAEEPTPREGIAKAAAAPPPAQVEDDGLDIPTFLRRGHAECFVKRDVPPTPLTGGGA